MVMGMPEDFDSRDIDWQEVSEGQLVRIHELEEAVAIRDDLLSSAADELEGHRCIDEDYGDGRRVCPTCGLHTAIRKLQAQQLNTFRG